MCGYLGQISKKQVANKDFDEINARITCRGPDEKISKKRILENNSSIFSYNLIFNRLAILDLSKRGSQPMSSERFDTTIIFNGEIYNHAECRSKLEGDGLNFYSNNSDTEVVLNGISLYGKNYINNLVGQFSFVFINNKTGYVLLARDRLGQKPLFYQFDKNTLSFSSDVKVVSQLCNNSELDESSLYSFLSLSVVPSPETIYKNIQKLEPGHLIEFDFNKSTLSPSLEKYWASNDFLDNQKFDSQEFNSLLDSSVSLRTKADVPIATFLSGGIDSTSIVKRQLDQGSQPNTFSVRYENDEFDESKWFNKVAEKYRTNHSVVDIKSDIDITDVFDSLDCLDEPYSDPSVLPSYLISKAISHQYKVAISGDGGDELFGGYSRTELALNRKNLYFSNLLFSSYPAVFGSGAKIKSKSKNIEDSYSSYLEDIKFLELLNIDKPQDYKIFYELSANNKVSDQKRLFLSDYKFFLPELMMLKVDRTSMANSLEVRSPYVDHRLVEYMFSHNISDNNLFRNKHYLKNYLEKDFDSAFVNRKKMGFVFNVEKFVYSNKDFFIEYFDKSDFIDNKTIRKLFRYKSRINANRVWKILTLDYVVKGKR